MGKRSARQHQRDQQIQAALQNTATRPGRLQRIARGISDDWKKPQRPSSASAPATNPSWHNVSRTWADQMIAAPRPAAPSRPADVTNQLRQTFYGLRRTLQSQTPYTPVSGFRRWSRMVDQGQSPSPEPQDPPPLYTEAIIGYRSWIIDVYHQLRPLHRGGPWEVGVNTAICDRYSSAERIAHSVPAHHCECGLYTYLDPHRARDYGHSRSAIYTAGIIGGRQNPMVVVTGAVASWGRIEVHRDGTRAQHAQILALEIPEGAEQRDADLIRTVAARYRVPAVPEGTLELEAARYGQTLPETALPDEPEPAKNADGQYVWPTPGQQSIMRGNTWTANTSTTTPLPNYVGHTVRWSDGVNVWETTDGGINWTRLA